MIKFKIKLKYFVKLRHILYIYSLYNEKMLNKKNVNKCFFNDISVKLWTICFQTQF